MRVHGVEIPEDLQELAIRKMKELSPFTAGEIQSVLMESLTDAWPRLHKEKPICRSDQKPRSVAHRATDRLIQRERTAGRITFSRKLWMWTGGHAKSS